MKDELGTLGAAIGMAVLACLFGGLTLAIYPGWSAIGGWTAKADAPAWVQAIGSVLAICIAVWVPWRQQKILQADRKASEKLLAQIAALGTVNQMDLLIGGLKGLITAVNSYVEKTPSEETLNFMLATMEQLELPSDETILRLSTLPSGVHLNLMQIAVKFRQGRSMLYLCTKPGTGEEGVQTSLNSIRRLLPVLLDISKTCVKQLHRFLEDDCRMIRNPDAPVHR